MIFDFRALASLSTTEQHKSQLTSAARHRQNQTPPARSQTAGLQMRHSSSHQLPQSRQLCSCGTSTRKPALASSEPQFALTLAYGLVSFSSHWPSSLPDRTAPHDPSQLPSGSAGREKQTSTSLIVTEHLSQTQLHSWRREQVCPHTRARTNCLKTVDLIRCSCAKVQPNSTQRVTYRAMLQSQVPPNLPLTIILKQGDLLRGLGQQVNQYVLLHTGYLACFCIAKN